MNYKLFIILAFVAISLIVILIIGNRDFSILFSSKKLEKVEIRFGYDSVQTLQIIDTQILNEFDSSLRSMKRTDKFFGGLSDTSATFFLLKGGVELNFLVSHSPYYGWSVGINGRQYDCPYLFDMVRSLPNSR